MEGTIRFTPRKDKVRKDGKTFLRVSYSLRDQRKIISTDIYIFPFLWDYKKESVQYFNKRDAKKISPIDGALNKIWQQIDYEHYPLSNDVDRALLCEMRSAFNIILSLPAITAPLSFC